METTTLDKLYLEWSQFTKAKTAKELRLREALENLEEALLQILQWVEAYPDDIFTPLQGDPIKHTGDYDTKEKRTLITRAAAMQGRHVATGIGRIARKALEER